MRRSGQIFGIILFVAIVLVSFKYLNFSEILRAFLHFPISYLLVVLVLATLITLARSWSFLIINKYGGINLSYWSALKSFIAGQVAATALPGGGAARGELVREETPAPKKVATGTSLLYVVIEFVSTVFVALAGGLLYRSYLWPLVIITVISLATVSMLLNRQFIKYIFIPFRHNAKVYKYKEKIIGIQTNSRIKPLLERGKNRSTLIKIILLALFTNLIGGLIFFLLCRGFGANTSIVQGVFLYSVSNLIMGISFVPAGLGVMEGGNIAIMTSFGIGFSLAAPISLLFRVITSLLNIIIGSIFLVFFYPKQIGIKKQ